MPRDFVCDLVSPGSYHHELPGFAFWYAIGLTDGNRGHRITNLESLTKAAGDVFEIGCQVCGRYEYELPRYGESPAE